MENIKLNNSKSDPLASPRPPANVVKPLEGDTLAADKGTFGKQAVVYYLVMVVLGLAVGSGVYAFKNYGLTRYAGRDVQVVNTPTEEGVKDASNFKDTATGKVISNDGKITGEGTHILIRGDISQNVYLTSSVIDLSKYENKNVQVWGETYKAQTAGWLMDIGRIKVQ